MTQYNYVDSRKASLLLLLNFSNFDIQLSSTLSNNFNFKDLDIVKSTISTYDGHTSSLI